jgi:hypothetical protein
VECDPALRVSACLPRPADRSCHVVLGVHGIEQWSSHAHRASLSCPHERRSRLAVFDGLADDAPMRDADCSSFPEDVAVCAMGLPRWTAAYPLFSSLGRVVASFRPRPEFPSMRSRLLGMRAAWPRGEQLPLLRWGAVASYFSCKG